MGPVLTYGAFDIYREGAFWLAREREATECGACMEIQSDTLELVVEALRLVYKSNDAPWDPVTKSCGEVPEWLKPWDGGDIARIVVTAQDLGMLPIRRHGIRSEAVRALAGAMLVAAVWSCVSMSTHPLLVDIGFSALHAT